MDLLTKIKNHSATVGVIGLGYVGLPLAIQFVKAGFNVTGGDFTKSGCAIVDYKCLELICASTAI